MNKTVISLSVVAAIISVGAGSEVVAGLNEKTNSADQQKGNDLMVRIDENTRETFQSHPHKNQVDSKDPIFFYEKGKLLAGIKLTKEGVLAVSSSPEFVRFFLKPLKGRSTLCL